MSPTLAAAPSRHASPCERLGFVVHDAMPEAFARLAVEHAVATPFQSAGWISAFLDAHGLRGDFRLVDIRDTAGNALLLPLVLHKQAGVCRGMKIGGAHASYFLPVTIGDVTGWAERAILGALVQAGAEMGIDAFLLADCPQHWDGRPNPLGSMPSYPAPSDGAGLTLGASGELVFDRIFDREGRKKQRYKRRKLSEIGVIRSGWVPGEKAGDAMLAAYFSWKARQFEALGVPDAFAAPNIRAFLEKACRGSPPLIRLFGLYLDERPIAVVGSAMAGRHVSGMFTAYDPDPAVSRFSPGEIVISDLIQALCDEGLAAFDLGAGEARYKSHFCPERIVLSDIALPVTVRGRLASLGWQATRRFKGMIKRNPGVYDLARRIRRRFA